MISILRRFLSSPRATRATVSALAIAAAPGCSSARDHQGCPAPAAECVAPAGAAACKGTATGDTKTALSKCVVRAETSGGATTLTITAYGAGICGVRVQHRFMGAIAPGTYVLDHVGDVVASEGSFQCISGDSIQWALPSAPDGGVDGTHSMTIDSVETSASDEPVIHGHLSVPLQPEPYGGPLAVELTF